MKILLILILALRAAYCGSNAFSPFEEGEVLEYLPTSVRLVSEILPRIRKGPHCTNFHIEWGAGDHFVKVGVIQTKLYSEDKYFNNHMRIAFIRVEEEYRDRGIGSEALGILITHSQALGIFSCFIAEAPHWDTGPRTNRVPFYERLGFFTYGYVDGDKDAGMIMCLRS